MVNELYKRPNQISHEALAVALVAIIAAASIVGSYIRKVLIPRKTNIATVVGHQAGLDTLFAPIDSNLFDNPDDFAEPYHPMMFYPPRHYVTPHRTATPTRDYSCTK